MFFPSPCCSYCEIPGAIAGVTGLPRRQLSSAPAALFHSSSGRGHPPSGRSAPLRHPTQSPCRSPRQQQTTGSGLRLFLHPLGLHPFHVSASADTVCLRDGVSVVFIAHSHKHWHRRQNADGDLSTARIRSSWQL